MIKISKTKSTETFSRTGKFDLDPTYYISINGFKDEEEQNKYYELLKQMIENPQLQIELKAKNFNNGCFDYVSRHSDLLE